MNRPPSKAEVDAIRARLNDNHPGDVSFGHEDIQMLFDLIDYKDMLLEDDRQEMREAGRELRDMANELRSLQREVQDQRGGW